MKRSILISAIVFLICLPAIAGIDEDRLTALHLECEEAYLVNDFIRMQKTIDQRNAIMYGEEQDAADTYAYNSHLALLYKDIGSLNYCLADIDGTSYDSAFSNYRKSLDIYLNVLRDTHGAAVLRTELAQLHYKSGEYAQALEYLTANREHFLQSGVERMELETWSQIALCKARLNQYDEAIADIDSTILLAGRFNIPVERLRKKGKILALRSEAENTPIKDAVPYFQQYYDFQRDSIVKHFNMMTVSERESYWLRMQPFVTDCFRLEDSAPDMLYDVVLFSKSILLHFSQGNADGVAPHWKDVQKKLGKDECAIEFVQYEKYGELYLGAIVLHPEGIPEFFRLLKVDDLLEFRLPIGVTVHDAVSKEIASYKNALYTCDDLNRIIWTKQLRNAINNADKVFFAADGILHRLAIEYMFPQDKSPKFRRLTSTREMLKEVEADADNGMLICGGIDHYRCSEEPDSLGNDRLAYELLARRRLCFRNLKGAEAEAHSIKDIRNNPADTLITGANADEQTLLSLMNDYGVVTIATHGYYGGGAQRCGTDLKTWKTDEKMSQSVLVVSGAQANMNNREFDPGITDGIISAREFSRTDLSNVRLLVLSACQSGLGEITSDGVFGLQRGLKNAGVSAMVVSLWEVNDDATRHFMVRFHTALSEGRTPGNAFDLAREAMEEVITVYDDGLDAATMAEGESRSIVRKKYNKPQYKNAFILIDSI